MFLRDPTTGGGGRDKEGAYMYVYDSCIASCLIFFQGTLLCCNLGTPHSEKEKTSFISKQAAPLKIDLREF